MTKTCLQDYGGLGMKGNIPEKMRKRNLQLILEALSNDNAMSVKELSAYTGLSVVSIHKLLDQLNTDNLIKESNEVVKTRGRSATQYALNYAGFSILSVRIFESTEQMHAKIEIIDLAGSRLSTDIFDYQITDVSSLMRAIQSLLGDAQRRPNVIIIGIPGVESNHRVNISDLTDWTNLNLSQEVATQTGIYTKVVNDANAMTYGAIGKVNSSGSAIGIYYPLMFAPGIGIIHQGQPLIGEHGLAGEIASGPYYEQQVFPIKDFTAIVVRDVQSLVTITDPDYVFIFAPQHQLNGSDVVAQLVDKHAFFKQYQFKFDTDFDDDYCFGLLRFGRELVFNQLINQ